MTLLMDSFEPIQVKQLMEKSIEVSQVPLNVHGYADYQWVACDGHTIQVERKQIDEILGGLDHVEEQLRREMTMSEEMILVYEGTVKQHTDSPPTVISWRMAKTGKVMVPHHTYHMSYNGLMAWFYQLDKAGVTVFHTFDYEHTARALVAWYISSQKQEHTTLKRYIKNKIHVDLKDYNPHVLSLMGIKNGGISEDVARALIARFGTFYYTISQEPSVLADTMINGRMLGGSKAMQILRAIGKVK